MVVMRLTRCPRCRAEDITADAHPARMLVGGQTIPVFVCRGCYRPADLEYRIACETNELPYTSYGIRDSLALLRDFYNERLRAELARDPLMDEDERERDLRPLRDALADVERRLAIAAV